MAISEMVVRGSPPDPLLPPQIRVRCSYALCQRISAPHYFSAPMPMSRNVQFNAPTQAPSAASAHQGARSFRLCEHFARMTPSHDPATGFCLAAFATEMRVGHLHDADAIAHGV